MKCFCSLFRFTMVILFLVLAFTSLIKAQSISGKVFDAKNDTPLSGVNVSVKNTIFGAVTDAEGRFAITGLNAGNYHLTLSRVDFLTLEKEVTAPEKELMLYLQPMMISLNNEVVITANRLSGGDYHTPQAISVLKAKEIAESLPRTLPEALSGSTGTFVQKTNHGGGSPVIRGLVGNQNLLVIDGIRLSNATFRSGPVQYLNTIDLSAVSQIEVLRGSGAVQYGSDALGGAIHILTREPSFSAKARFSGSITGKMVSDNLEESGRVELMMQSEDVAFLVGFTYRDFGNIVAGKGIGMQDFTGYNEYGGDAKFITKLGKNGKIIVGFQYFKQEDVPRTDKLIAENGKDPDYQVYSFDPQIRRLTYIKVEKNTNKKLFKSMLLTLSYQVSDEARIMQKVNSTKITRQQDIVDTYGVSAEFTSKFGKNWQISTGFDFYTDFIGSTSFDEKNGVITPGRGLYPDDSKAASAGLFTNHQYRVKHLVVSAGLRFNTFKLQAEDKEFGDVDYAPSALVGNFGVIYEISQHHNLAGSVNTGFRAPNINDMGAFGTFSYGIEVPNPDLKPEKATSFELGWKSKYDHWSASVFVFRNNLSDFIDRVKSSYNGDTLYDSARVYTKENVLNAYTQGLEFSSEIKPWKDLSLTMTAVYTYGQNESKDEPLSKIPPFYGRISARYQFTDFLWAQAEWLGAGKQARLSSGDKSDSRINPDGTPAWNVINVRAGARWKWFTLTAGLSNIFNKAYRYHGSGVDGYGRSLWVSLRYQF